MHASSNTTIIVRVGEPLMVQIQAANELALHRVALLRDDGDRATELANANACVTDPGSATNRPTHWIRQAL